MRQQYEDRAQNPAETRKVHELENEVQRTKTYYQKRIRELEDKYKFKVNIGTKEDGLSDLVPEPATQKLTTTQKGARPQTAKASSSQDAKKLEEQIQQMTTDRNMLVGRLQTSVKKVEMLEAELSRYK